MKANLVSATEPLIDGVEGIDEYIAYVARVSNPGNQLNNNTAPKLIRYLMRNKHWSPFEMAHATIEIETTRDIAHQIIRHRSFAYQEFSQRYAAVDLDFEYSETRMQDTKNRQNSIETEDTVLAKAWTFYQREVAKVSERAYNWALDNGIAKELARKVLPEGMTPTKLYMSGSIRSWIHYIELRSTPGTQKEHREVALACKPIIEELINYDFTD